MMIQRLVVDVVVIFGFSHLTDEVLQLVLDATPLVHQLTHTSLLLAAYFMFLGAFADKVGAWLDR